MDLSDALRARMEAPDTRCGPPVDLWGAALRSADVQQQPQEKRTDWRQVLVILGTGEVWR